MVDQKCLWVSEPVLIPVHEVITRLDTDESF
jgi:hypothetical protein